MKPNRTLLALITDQAKKDYVGRDDDLSSWRRHWFETAEKIRADFIAQGLIATADAVSTLIEWDKKYAMADTCEQSTPS